MKSDWDDLLKKELVSPYFLSLKKFLEIERQSFTVFPPAEDVFHALDITSLHETTVVILGQDPYHGSGHAHGLAFSTLHRSEIPPSLRNILKELHNDVGAQIPLHGDLTSWAKQGVLLLNTTLTVREGEAGSHQGHGWETFTDALISAVNAKQRHVVFLLWGTHARKKKQLITNSFHTVIEGVHPSPLSAYRGFFGSQPFSKVNDALIANGQSPIDWNIPSERPLKVRPNE